MHSLEKSILKTTAYFDIFDYPLTLVELTKWLRSDGQEKFELGDLNEYFLAQDSQKNHSLDYDSGFVFLAQKAELRRTRQERAAISERKFKRVIRVITILRLIPYLKMIAVCNTLAYQNPKETSDIDLFVVAKSGRIWTVRFWVALILKVFQLRPGEAKRDPICPSFFVTEDNLNLEKIQLTQGDPYMQYWIAQVYPVFDPYRVSNKFFTENSWIKTYLPNVIPPRPSKRRRVEDNAITKFVRKIQEFDINGVVGNFFESLLKRFQMKILPDKLKQMANQDTRVIISDDMLKFHDDDRRQEFAEEYERKLRELSLRVPM